MKKSILILSYLFLLNGLAAEPNLVPELVQELGSENSAQLSERRKHSHSHRHSHHYNKKRGPRGCPGPRGPVGITGFKGFQGLRGPMGTVGTQGAVGAQGATGATGATGVTGAAGFTGPTGATGVSGGTGSTGPTGVIDFAFLYDNGPPQVIPRLVPVEFRETAVIPQNSTFSILGGGFGILLIHSPGFYKAIYEVNFFMGTNGPTSATFRLRTIDNIAVSQNIPGSAMGLNIISSASGSDFSQVYQLTGQAAFEILPGPNFPVALVLENITGGTAGSTITLTQPQPIAAGFTASLASLYVEKLQ